MWPLTSDAGFSPYRRVAHRSPRWRQRASGACLQRRRVHQLLLGHCGASVSQRLRSSCAPSISLNSRFQRVDLRAEIIDTRAQRSYIGIDLGHQSFKFTFELFVDAKAQFADRITEGFDLILGKNTVVVSDFIGQASGVWRALKLLRFFYR